ncbi:MAG: helix-turn-helix domain-containing protein [Calothrix sp. C42_A2020_038]|nr:helix-turn-helix domain-containing protein [Calothrix sp. C42_A2020_038]
MKWLRAKEKIEQSPSLDEQRAHILAEIGAKLRETRQGYGFDLDDVVAYTKIARRLLQAIEDANFNNLPEPIYTQGLIKRYADALGFNGMEIANKYPIGVNRVNLISGWKSKSQRQLRPVHLYLIYVGLIICSVSGLSHVLNIATVANNSPNQSKLQNTASQPKKNQQFALQPASNNQTNNENNRQVQVGVILKDSSWIRVEADGKTEFEGILPQGTQRTWKANSQLIVRAGNAGGVMVSVNQQQPKPMGQPGKPEEMKIAANTRS